MCLIKVGLVELVLWISQDLAAIFLDFLEEKVPAKSAGAHLGSSGFAEGGHCLSHLFRAKCMMRLVSACLCWRDAFFQLESAFVDLQHRPVGMFFFFFFFCQFRNFLFGVIAGVVEYDARTRWRMSTSAHCPKCAALAGEDSPPSQGRRRIWRETTLRS